MSCSEHDVHTAAVKKKSTMTDTCFYLIQFMKIIALAVRAGHEEVFFSPLFVDSVLQFHLHKT